MMLNFIFWETHVEDPAVRSGVRARLLVRVRVGRFLRSLCLSVVPILASGQRPVSGNTFLNRIGSSPQHRNAPAVYT
jgi:hypothetical protein